MHQINKYEKSKVERIPSSAETTQCVWDQLSVVLCSEVVEVVLGGGATAGVQEEEEVTPLEVLTELCWMASF